MQGPSILAAEKKALPEQKILPDYLKVSLYLNKISLTFIFEPNFLLLYANQSLLQITQTLRNHKNYLKKIRK